MTKYNAVVTVSVPCMRALTIEAESEAEAVAKATALAGTSPATELVPQWDLVSVLDEHVSVKRIFETFYYSHCGRAWNLQIAKSKCPRCDQTVEAYDKE